MILERYLLSFYLSSPNPRLPFNRVDTLHRKDFHIAKIVTIIIYHSIDQSIECDIDAIMGKLSRENYFRKNIQVALDFGLATTRQRTN